MSPVNVLDFVARELNGQIMTVSSLSAFVAAEKAADRLAMTAISREAAQLAVLLPKAPLERICREFGSETADIVEALRPKGPFSRIALEAIAVHGNSGNDEVRRDAAIAACAAEAAVASPEDGERMRECLEFMADRETEPERSGFLKDLRAQLPGPGPADPEGESRGRATVISISMDVCGSTEAKTRMRACARNDEELAEWYKAFHRQFLLSEWRFYSQLFQDGHRGLDWDWKHAFVVKGIGDEDLAAVRGRRGRPVETAIFGSAPVPCRPHRGRPSDPMDVRLGQRRARPPTLGDQESAAQVLYGHSRQRLRGQRATVRFRDGAPI